MQATPQNHRTSQHRQMPQTPRQLRPGSAQKLQSFRERRQEKVPRTRRGSWQVQHRPRRRHIQHRYQASQTMGYRTQLHRQKEYQHQLPWMRACRSQRREQDRHQQGSGQKKVRTKSAAPALAQQRLKKRPLLRSESLRPCLWQSEM